MKNKGFTLAEVLIAVAVLIPVGLGLLYVLALWTDRTLDFWVSFIKHCPVDVPMWLSFLATIILNGAIFGINIISEIARFCI